MSVHSHVHPCCVQCGTDTNKSHREPRRDSAAPNCCGLRHRHQKRTHRAPGATQQCQGAGSRAVCWHKELICSLLLTVPSSWPAVQGGTLGFGVPPPRRNALVWFCAQANTQKTAFYTAKKIQTDFYSGKIKSWRLTR